MKKYLWIQFFICGFQFYAGRFIFHTAFFCVCVKFVFLLMFYFAKYFCEFTNHFCICRSCFIFTDNTPMILAQINLHTKTWAFLLCCCCCCEIRNYFDHERRWPCKLSSKSQCQQVFDMAGKLFCKHVNNKEKIWGCGRRQNEGSWEVLYHLPLTPTLGLSQLLWCHHRPPNRLCDVISGQSNTAITSRPPPPPRGWARSGQTVFSLFCQQSFLKEIFFQRNCFCLILYGCLGTLSFSPSLSPSLRSFLFLLSREIQLILHTYTD